VWVTAQFDILLSRLTSQRW